jgi:histidine triad (HIT) family protein
MDECLFCKITRGEIPAEKIIENEHVVGFKDIYPQASHHFLFIHKEHTKNLMDTSGDQLNQIFNTIKEYAKTQNIEEDGFRVVTNCGPNAGQTVFHTHFHLVYGEKLKGFGS